MFNPFYPFTSELLHGMVAQGKRYFVRQRFSRGLSVLASGELTSKQYLITHYANLVTAQDHYGTIAHDPNRFLYNWDDIEHREKLRRAAEVNEQYGVYGAVLREDWESLITETVEAKVRGYVDSLGWKPKKSDAVNFVFELRFGELYAAIRYRNRRATAKFEDIENS
jgi:hypothetical protein